MSAKSVPPAKCPICQTETQPKWRPFCSKRCADVDLGRWMSGSYAIPAEEEEPGDFLETDQGES